MTNIQPTRRGEATRPLRVLVVAPSFDILGGQAVQAARLVTRLRELSQLEVGFLPINPRLPGVLRTLQAVKYLRTIVTSLLYVATLLARVPRYDVIHVFSASYFSFVIAPTPAILIAKFFRKRVVLNYHSGEAEDHLTRWRTAVPTIRLADEVVVPSVYLVKVFAKFGVAARSINNLIELDQFAFKRRQPLRPRFLSNRNLDAHYGVDHVLRAFALIQKRIPEAELLIAGDGSQRQTLENLSLQLKLQNTSFVGRVEHEEIFQQYQNADIYLNGSEIDNQPLSILEAFACGLPVVTTNAGGIPDMVTDSRTGFVVQQGDHEAMAARALQLLAEANVAESLTRRAREECEKYSWRAVREQWAQLYCDQVSERQTTGGVPHASRFTKLRKMGLAEGRDRFRRTRAALIERVGFSSLTKLPSDRALRKLFDPSFGLSNQPDLFEHFRDRKAPTFFGGFDQPTRTIMRFRSRWPGADVQIVAQANRIVAGQFDLLGYKDLNFGNPIDWQRDLLSGKSAPQVHWSRVDFLNADACGDHKIIWELNRHQYFTTLGQAYWFTADEKYAETFVAHLNSWMDQNPPKVGINWASSLEVAFRSISWLWALYYFKDSRALDAQTFARAIKFLYLNARHLETYLSTYFSPNTHLTGEALGLFYLGTMLPEFKEASRWRDQGRNILVGELDRQVRPDGVYFEQSTYYHRYTTDFYTHLLLLSRSNNDRLNSVVEEKLKLLLDHLMYITRPDGTTPLLGDDDGGRLVMLDRKAVNDFRATLSNGAVLFGRGDYKYVAGEFAEESLWLFGSNGVRAFDDLQSEEPSRQSKQFSNGGYYVMRDGWHGKANYLLFDCGPHGADNCGHAHADALAIEVVAKGRPMLVDSGTYTYTGSAEKRNSFRESAAHNVLLVDGASSSVAAGPFSWKSISRCETTSWLSKSRFDYVEGRHDGYRRLPEQATHTRSILFLKNDYWVMRDRLESAGSHKLDLRFHFAPRLSPDRTSADNVEVTSRNAGLQLAAFGKDGHWSREQGLFSHCYGMEESAAVCMFSANFSGNHGGTDELITFLLPNSGRSTSPFRVNEVEAIGGRAFEISSRDHRDLVVLRDSESSRVETVRLTSDFNLSWARFSHVGQEDLLELLVMNGQNATLDGREILRSARDVQYLVASRAGEGFQVETSEARLDLQFPIGNQEQPVAERAGQKQTVRSVKFER
jgi:glycosyltransferase involved in cell wall biosynthesis